VSAWLSTAGVMFFGLAGGIAVGSGMVAFLIVLDVIQRLAQVSHTYSYLQRYEEAVIAGALVFTVLDFAGVRLSAPPLVAGAFGLFAGCFVGLLASALTEVINVLPILAKRVGLEAYMLVLLMAMVFGKVFGSLFEWLFY